MNQIYSEPMYVHELVIKSSLHVMIADKNHPKPVGWGTGAAIYYKGKVYLMSVAHVNDWTNLSTFYETNLPSSGHPLIKGLGGFCYFSAFKFEKNFTEDEFINAIEMKSEPIDITFCEITEPFVALQPALDFGAFKIRHGDKVIIDLESSISIPSKDQSYSFYGMIKHKYMPDGITLSSEHAFKHGLKYHSTKGQFHIFLAKEIITDSDEYRGTSGAPIYDDNGGLVGLACRVRRDSKIVYGFSIDECKRFLDYALQTGTL